jgi:hypothetical protein
MIGSARRARSARAASAFAAQRLLLNLVRVKPSGELVHREPQPRLPPGTRPRRWPGRPASVRHSLARPAARCSVWRYGPVVPDARPPATPAPPVVGTDVHRHAARRRRPRSRTRPRAVPCLCRCRCRRCGRPDGRVGDRTTGGSWASCASANDTRAGAPDGEPRGNRFVLGAMTSTNSPSGVNDVITPPRVIGGPRGRSAQRPVGAVDQGTPSASARRWSWDSCQSTKPMWSGGVSVTSTTGTWADRATARIC